MKHETGPVFERFKSENWFYWETSLEDRYKAVFNKKALDKRRRKMKHEIRQAFESFRSEKIEKFVDWDENWFYWKTSFEAGYKAGHNTANPDKWETPQEWEERTGKKLQDDDVVWYRYITDEHDDEFKLHCLAIKRCFQENALDILVAIPGKGKPPQDYREE